MIGRRLFLAAALPVAAAMTMAVTGCGWEPLYADQQTGAAAAGLRAIQVRPISERIGQQLEMSLRDSLNPDRQPATPLYALNVSLTRSLQDLGIQSQGLGTRGLVTVSANYQLTDIKTNKVLQSGFVHANDSFDIQASGYSTVVAQTDAATRNVEEIRREIVARLTMFLQGKAPGAS